MRDIAEDVEQFHRTRAQVIRQRLVHWKDSTNGCVKMLDSCQFLFPGYEIEPGFVFENLICSRRDLNPSPKLERLR